MATANSSFSRGSCPTPCAESMVLCWSMRSFVTSLGQVYRQLAAVPAPGREEGMRVGCGFVGRWHGGVRAATGAITLMCMPTTVASSVVSF